MSPEHWQNMWAIHVLMWVLRALGVVVLVFFFATPVLAAQGSWVLLCVVMTSNVRRKAWCCVKRVM